MGSAPSRVSFDELDKGGALTIGDGYRTRRDELGRPGFPILRVAQVGEGTIDGEPTDFIRHEYERAIGPKLSMADDVVLTTKGTFGRRTRIRPGQAGYAYSPQVCWFRIQDPARLDPGYLYYWLGSADFANQASGLKSQTDMADYLSLRDLRRVRVPLPPVAEQRRIAGVLGAFDDKIEVNQRMATTLEILGRFTYRQWRETLPLTDFWPLGDVCQVSSGGTPARRSEELWAGPIPWISPKVMTSIHCDEPEEWVSPAAIGRGTRLAPAGSTLVMVRGMGLHERVRVSQAREDVTFNQDVKSLTPVDLEPAMLLFSVLDAQEVLLARVESSGHGTGVLPTSALTGHLVAAPRADVRRAVAERLELLNARIGVARSAARTLASLRDALLPRLLGGPEMR